jgi:hypothetical protein
MSRRYGNPLFGNRYCGNKIKMEVHDQDNEDKSASGCQIDEIIRAGHAKMFSPDTLSQANSEHYDNCAKCIGDSHR